MDNIEIGFGNSMQNIIGISNAMQGLATRGTNLVGFFQRPINWDGLGAVQRSLDSFANNMQRSADAVLGFMKPGIDFEQKMSELKAGTGATDEQMKLMSISARKMATDFGLEATQGADAYLTILSKLGPKIAETPIALEAMGKSTALLAKGMNGDMKGATDALTTMMNAYNIDVSKPEEAAKKMQTMADMMTVSFKEGAVDVPQIAESMKKIGPIAYQANIGLAETLATLQILGQKGGKEASEAGNAFKNASLILAQGELMPEKTLGLLKGAGVNISQLTDKTLPFADRMNALKKIAGNDALLAEFFGKENITAGQAILQNLPQIREQMVLTQNATGASAQYAATVMDTTQGRIDRMKSAFTEVSLSAYESLKPYVPMISLSASLATTTSAMLPLFSTFGTLLRGSVGGILRYGAGLTYVNGQLVFQRASLLGAMIGMARYAGTMLVQGVSSLGLYLIAQGATTTGTLLFNAALSANPIGIVVVGIAVLGAALYGLYSYFGGFGNMMLGLWNLVKEYNPFSLLAKAIDYVFGTNLMGSVSTFFSFVEEKVMWLWNKIKGLGELLGITDAAVEAKGFSQPAPLIANAGIKPAFDFNNPLGAAGVAIANPITDIAGKGSQMDKFVLPTKAADMPKTDKLKKGLDGVSGGGSKQTNITINLEKLQDQTVFNTTNIKESMQDMENTLIKGLQRVLNSTNQYQAG